MQNDEEVDLAQPLVSGAVNITDVFGLGRAAKALTPTAEKLFLGLGSAFEIVAGPARTYLEQRAAGAAARHELSANTKAFGELLNADPALVEEMKHRLVMTEVRRQCNIRNAANKAVTIANEQSNDGQAHNIDPDFAAEWIDGVKDVSDDSVQELWARALAYAPTTPVGRISKPALELLKQFDRRTALMFSEFCGLLRVIGLPSTSFDFGKLKTEIHIGLLQDLGVVREGFADIRIPDLGQVINPVGSLKCTCWILGNRSIELANALQPYSEILDDPKSVLEALVLQLDGLTKIRNPIKIQIEQAAFFLCNPSLAREPDAASVSAVLNLEQYLSGPAKHCLLELARAGRLRLGSLD